MGRAPFTVSGMNTTHHTATVAPATRTVARATLANVMLAGILACVVVGLYLMGVEASLAATVAVVVGVLIKFDDARIRRNRRKAQNL